MRKIIARSPWLISYANHDAPLRMFCFPYAGGSATIFKDWGNFIPENIEICAIQLPGRGSRMREKAHTNTPELILDLHKNLLSYIKEKQCIFYGHSMGALIAFELARLLRDEENLTQLVVSGHRAPHLPLRLPTLYDLPPDKFLQEIKNLGGMQKQIVENVELMNLLSPIIRADFTICDTYQYQETEPLHIPISALGGINDPRVNSKEIELWQKHTTEKFYFQILPGEHFFIHSHESVFFDVVVREILSIF